MITGRSKSVISFVLACLLLFGNLPVLFAAQAPDEEWVNLLAADMDTHFDGGTSPFTSSLPTSGGSQQIIQINGNNALEFRDASLGAADATSYYYRLTSGTLFSRINEIYSLPTGSAPVEFVLEYKVKRTAASDKPVDSNIYAQIQFGGYDNVLVPRFPTGSPSPSIAKTAAYLNTQPDVMLTVNDSDIISYRFKVVPNGGQRKISMVELLFSVRVNTGGTEEAYAVDDLAVYEVKQRQSDDFEAPSAPANLAVSGLTDTSIDLSWQASTDNVGVTAYEIYRDGQTKLDTVNGSATSASLVGLSPNTTYQITVKAKDLGGNLSAASNEVTFTTAPSAGGLPEPFGDRDIGSVGVAGSASYSDGAITVKGAGADIFDAEDAFHFVYQPVTGDAEIVARLSSWEAVAAWTKAGVMIRGNITKGSPYGMVALSRDFGTVFQDRLLQSGPSTSINGTPEAKAPYWLKLVREGNLVSAYDSDNGTRWKLIKQEIIDLPQTVYFGLAVTSHNNPKLATAVFDHVRVGSILPPEKEPPSPFPGTIESRKQWMWEKTKSMLEESGPLNIAQYVAQILDGENVTANLQKLDAMYQTYDWEQYKTVSKMYAYLMVGDRFSSTMVDHVKDYFSKYDYKYLSQTENLRISNYTAGYLMGQYFPDTPDLDGTKGAALKNENRANIEAMIEAGVRKGWAEYESPEYTFMTYYCLNAIYQYSDEPDFRQKAKMAMDIMWFEWANDWIDGNFISTSNRAKGDSVSADDLTWRSMNHTALAWSYFGGHRAQQGVGDADNPSPSTYRPNLEFLGMLYSPGMSYEPPEMAVRIGQSAYKDYSSRKSNLQNSSGRDMNTFRQAYVKPLWGLATEVSYNMVDNWIEDIPVALRWQSDSQNSLFRLSVDQPGTPIGNYDQPANHRIMQDGGAAVGVFKAVDPEFNYINAMFPDTGSIIARQDEAGWVFCDTGPMYFAFKMIKPYNWYYQTPADPANKIKATATLHPTQTLITNYNILRSQADQNGWVLETADASQYADFAAFKQAILGNTTVDSSRIDEANPRLVYTSLNGDVLDITFDTARAPYANTHKINNTPIDYYSFKIFDTPWLQQDRGAPFFTASQGGETLVYNFANWTISQTGDPIAVPNGGFEGGATKPDSWTGYTAVGGPVLTSWDTAVSRRESGHSVKITGAAAADQGGWSLDEANWLPAEPGTQYTFRAWVKTANAVEAAGARAGITFYKSDGATASVGTVYSVPMRGTTNWTQIQVSATAPTDAARIKLDVSLAGKGTAWFDDAELVALGNHPVTGIVLDQNTLSVGAGKTAVLTANVLPANATNKTVVWSTDKPSVATVDSHGQVTAAAPGTAVITATTADGAFSASCTVTVTVEPLFSESFANGLGNWDFFGSTAPWSVVGAGEAAQMKGSASGGPYRAVVKSAQFPYTSTDYNMEFTASGDRFRVIFRYTGSSSYYFLELKNTKSLEMWKYSPANAQVGATVDLGIAVPSFNMADTHQYRLEAKGSSFTLYVDGNPAASFTDSDLTAGGIGFAIKSLNASSTATVLVDDVAVKPIVEVPKFGIVHTPTTDIPYNADLPVSFTVTGSGAVNSASVHYAYGDEAPDRVIPAAGSGAEAYSALIPGTNETSLIRYYITAEDDKGLEVRYPETGDIAVSIGDILPYVNNFEDVAVNSVPAGWRVGGNTKVIQLPDGNKVLNLNNSGSAKLELPMYMNADNFTAKFKVKYERTSDAMQNTWRFRYRATDDSNNNAMEWATHNSKYFIMRKTTLGGNYYVANYVQALLDEWHDYELHVSGITHKLFIDGREIASGDDSDPLAPKKGYFQWNVVGGINLLIDDFAIEPIQVPAVIDLQPSGNYAGIYSREESPGFKLALEAGAEAHDFQIDYTVKRADGDKATVVSGSKTYSLAKFGKMTDTVTFAPRIDGIGTYEVAADFLVDGVLQAAKSKKMRFVVVAQTAPVSQPDLDNASKFGLNTHYSLNWNDDIIDGARKLGARHHRSGITWEAVDRNVKDGSGNPVYDYSSTDQQLDKLFSYGFNQITGLSIDKNSYYQQGVINSTAGLKAVGDFVANTVSRYKDRIRQWEMPNEPEIFSKPYVPSEYVQLQKITYLNMKKADPNAMLLAGDHTSSVLSVLPKELQLGSFDYADAYSYHPYVYNAMPDGNLQNIINGVKDLVNAYGGWKDYYLTEGGWPTANAGYPSVSQETQRDYIVRAFLNYMVTDQIKAYEYYNYKNDGTDDRYYDIFWGITDNDGRPKLAYAAVNQLMTTLDQARYIGTWEMGDPDVAVQVFTNNGVPVIAAWKKADHKDNPAVKPPVSLITLPFGADGVSIRDINGNTVPASAGSGGNLQLSVSGSPVYITGAPADFVYRAAAKLLQDKQQEVSAKLDKMRTAENAALLQADAAELARIGMQLETALAGGSPAQGLEQEIKDIYALMAQIAGQIKDGALEQAPAYVALEALYNMAETASVSLAYTISGTAAGSSDYAAAAQAVTDAYNAKKGDYSVMPVSTAAVLRMNRYGRLADSAYAGGDAANGYAYNLLAREFAHAAAAITDSEPTRFIGVLANVVPTQANGEAGYANTVTLSLVNSTQEPQEVTVKLHVPEGWEVAQTAPAAETITLSAGGTLDKTYFVQVPENTLKGRYDITFEILHNGLPFDTKTVQLTVEDGLDVRLLPVKKTIEELDVLTVQLTGTSSFSKTGKITVKGPGGIPLEPVTTDAFSNLQKGGSVQLDFRWTYHEPAPFNEYTVDLQVEETDRDKLIYHDPALPLEFNLIQEARDLMIDGDLGDWQDAFPFHLRSKSQHAGGYRDPDNLEATAYAKWAAGGLYLAVSVQDDIHKQSENPANMWKNDSIQISLDPLNNRESPYGADDTEWGFALADDGRLLVNIFNSTYPNPNGDVSGQTPFMAKRDEEARRTVYELQIPAAYVKDLKPELLGKIGLNVAVNDADLQNGRDDFVQWTKGTADSKNTSFYDSFLFISYTPPEPPADALPPVWPENAAVTATKVMMDSVALSWSNAQDNVAVTRYRINWGESVADAVYGTVTGSVYAPAAFGTVTGSVYTSGAFGTVTGLKADTLYTFAVSARDAAGNWSAGGPEITVRTLAEPPAGDMTAPMWTNAVLTVSDRQTTALTLAWSPALDDTGVTQYKIYVNGAERTTVTGSVYSYTVTGLVPGTAYSFKVEAGDASGNWSTDGPAVAAMTDAVQSDGGDTVSTAPIVPEPEKNDSGVRIYSQESVEKRGDGTSYVRLVVAAGDLERAADMLMDQAKPIITLRANSESGDVKAEWPAGGLASLAQTAPDAVISVITAAFSYSLPLSTLPADVLGTTGKDSRIIISMEKVGSDTRKALADSAQASGIGLPGDPVAFGVYVEANGTSREIQDFGHIYTTRTIQLAAPVQASEATVLRYDPVSGELSFVPAVFRTVDGKTEVTIKHMGNGIYTVAQGKRTFADLAQHWARQDVELLAGKLIVKGESETVFAPERSVTRAEFIAMLVRALGIAEAQGAAGFKDVAATDWYAGILGAAVKAGLADGFEDGSFRPDESITREQMAALVLRALTFAGTEAAGEANPERTLAQFRDQAAIASWSKPAVAALAEAGIIQGMTDASFEPAAQASRAQAAVILKRLLLQAGFINS